MKYEAFFSEEVKIKGDIGSIIIFNLNIYYFEDQQHWHRYQVLLRPLCVPN